MRMRLVRKKCGRLKARLIVQGFREPKSWDVGGTDAPTAALSTIRTLLFMGGHEGDVISSIGISTAFLQANLHPSDPPPRYVYYQEGNLPRQYYVSTSWLPLSMDNGLHPKNGSLLSPTG